MGENVNKLMYCAMSLQVEGITVGRFHSWETPQRERDPGRKTVYTFPEVHFEVFPEEVELAVGPITIFGIYDLLTDPQKTFSVTETLNNKQWTYTGCWVERPSSIKVVKGSTIDIRSPMHYQCCVRK